MRGIGDIIGVLRLLLPPWALALLGVAVALWILPKLRYRARAKQILGSVRRMVRADESTRAGLFAWTLELAGSDVFLLVDVANEAQKRGMIDLWEAALQRLEALPTGRPEAARLRRAVARVVPEPMHPLEVVVRVEALLEQGAREAARERLSEALARHPGDPDLQALALRVAADDVGDAASGTGPGASLDANTP